MAVVFISPKQRQKMFFLGIAIGFLVFLVVVFLGVFLSEPKEFSLALVFNKPKVNIDMGIFDSDQFKNLQLFPDMQTQYSYNGLTKDNKTQTGFIFADSEEDAKTMVSKMGLSVIEVKEAEIGRDNPFAPYYQSISTAKKTSK